MSRKKGRASGRFTQHRKLDRLQEALNARAAGLTLAELSGLLRASERTVRRYLAELGRMVELESVALEPGGAHIWRIKPSERGRTVTLRRTQAQGLLAVRPLFEVFRGSALFDEFEGAFGDMLRIAERPVRTQRGEVAADAKLERRFFFISGPTRSLSLRGEDIDSVFVATLESRVLSFVHKATAGKKGRTLIHPHALYVENGSLHILSLMSAVPMSVPVDEMESIKVEDARFDAHGTADFSKWLTPLGLEREGSTVHKIALEFDASLLPLAKTLRIHPTQRLAFATDGRFRVHFSSTLLDAARTFVLQMLPHVTVIEPKVLAESVRTALERATARHAAVK
jgi:predicted DNA-binding transcriptional regulator YafY